MSVFGRKRIFLGGSLMHGTTRTHFTNTPTLINVVLAKLENVLKQWRFCRKNTPLTFPFQVKLNLCIFQTPHSGRTEPCYVFLLSARTTQTSTVMSPEPPLTQRWVDIGWNLNVGCTQPLIIWLSTAEGGCYLSRNHLYHKSLSLFDVIARLTTFAWLLTAKSSRLRNFIWCFQS